jgi:ArsR family transcriptional regulator, lead/cadmium/zinc/bismuth-responsive transcriptional repressor
MAETLSARITAEHPYERTNVVRLCRMSRDPDTCELFCLDLPKAEAARRDLPSSAELDTWAGAAKALGDPTRLAVAVALGASETACVCDLAWIVGRDEKLISHHVRALRAAGLATSTRDGKMVMYALTERGRALLTAVTATATSA